MTTPAVKRANGDPGQHCRAWRTGLDPGGAALLCVEFELPASWLAEAAPIALTALYLHQDGKLKVAVLPGQQPVTELPPAEQFNALVQQRRAFVAEVGQPLPLNSLAIIKPWGEEVWFTGAEQRGVCDFGTRRASTPLPWLLAALPDRDTTRGFTPPALLKILYPLAEAVAGDLYFEVHDLKREVYVVTHVDRRAWPDGVGQLRLGFCPQRLAASKSESAFKAEYLAAVNAYRAVREQIDALPKGTGLAPELTEREVKLRTVMDAFTALRPVRAGDVVEVPRMLPHALQHGVTVVEFQTPVFERKILSFAQKVLTQSGWDTAEAVRHMRLLAPPPPDAEVLVDEPRVRVEKVAEIPEFELQRLRIEPGGTLQVIIPGDHGLAMVLEGGVGLNGCDFRPNQAAWFPGQWQGELAVPKGEPVLVMLLALVRS